MKKFTYILIIVLFCSVVLSEPNDPNAPVPMQQVQVRLLTSEETLALSVNDIILQELIADLLDQELVRQVIKARYKLSGQLTLSELNKK